MEESPHLLAGLDVRLFTYATTKIHDGNTLDIRRIFVKYVHSSQNIAVS
jgi:hypothetical protein